MIVVAAKLIGSGIASIGVIGAGIGIGTIFGSYLIAISRNPIMKGGVIFYYVTRFRTCRSNSPFCFNDEFFTVICVLSNICRLELQQ